MEVHNQLPRLTGIVLWLLLDFVQSVAIQRAARLLSDLANNK